ncbi:hypothetical protein Tco_0185968 [Tanacetum coccineum]
MTRNSTKEFFTPFEEPERVFHSTRKLCKTTSLDYSSSPEFNLFLILRIKGMRRKFYPPSRTSRKIEANRDNSEVKWDPNNIEFEIWLALKFRNHTTTYGYTKNALWDYWRRGNDEELITDSELSNPRDDNLIKENKIAQIFRIDTDLFDFDTPLCHAFKEFNYISQIDVDVLTKDIPGFKTYEEYKDDWIYDWNKDLINKKTLDESTNVMEELSDDKWDHDLPVDEWKDYEHTTYIKTNVSSNQMTYNEVCQIVMDYNDTQGKQGWFDEHELMGEEDDDINDLEDYLIQKDLPYYVNEEEETSKERRFKLLGVPFVKPPTCKTEKFEVVKYSFGPARNMSQSRNMNMIFGSQYGVSWYMDTAYRLPVQF